MEAETARQLLEQIASQQSRSRCGDIPVGFDACPEISTARYVDQEFWDIEQRLLWPRTWLLAGHTGELPDIGSYKLWDESGVPIVVVRGKNGAIRAFYNACRHRGGPLVSQEQGRGTVLSCKFHAWTYDLDGLLKFVPDEHDFPGLDKRELSLEPLRCELWGNFIFVNRDANALPLLEWLGTMVPELEDFDFSKRKVFAKVEYEMDCNWKTGIESNIETYHLATVHPDTINKLLDHSGCVVHLYRYGHSRMIVPYNREHQDEFEMLDYRDRPSREILTREGIRSYSLMPNLLLAADEHQFPIISYWPLGIDKTRMVLYYTSPQAEEGDAKSEGFREIAKGFEIALDEDRFSLRATQQSYAKRLIKTIRLGYSERRLHHLQLEIDRVIGVENVPVPYRVAQGASVAS